MLFKLFIKTLKNYNKKSLDGYKYNSKIYKSPKLTQILKYKIL